MTTTKTAKKLISGGPAFPGAFNRAEDKGMFLRDYFAAQALPAALYGFYQAGGPGGAWSDHDDLAEHVWNVADAMMRARGSAFPEPPQ